MNHIPRFFSALLFAPVFGVVLYAAGCSVEATAEPAASDEQALDLATGEDVALAEGALAEGTETGVSALAAEQTCYSARKCTGKVLSHRDFHNCKVKSRGKSWKNSSGMCHPI